VSKVKGFFHPKTATGRSSLLPSPPWFYSGDLLTVEYRTDPARVADLLPDPLRLADDDPGAVAFIWADWQSCAQDGEQLMDPVLGQYKEAFVVVRCQFEGQVFSRCVFIWVDTDFAIARGIHQGYPKKLGSIYQTRPHPYGPAPRIAEGARFGASLAAADRRLAEARITLTEPSAINGFVNDHKMAHNRWVSSIDKPGQFTLDEIIATGAASGEGGQAWKGTVDMFNLFESPTEELHLVEPQEFIGAYYKQVGVKWDGGEVLYRNPAVHTDAARVGAVVR
jgi:acetoacetate decarboxylase